MEDRRYFNHKGSLTRRDDVLVHCHTRLELSQVCCGPPTKRHGGLFLEDNVMYVFGPGGGIRDWSVFIGDSKGSIALYGLALD